MPSRRLLALVIAVCIAAGCGSHSTPVTPVTPTPTPAPVVTRVLQIKLTGTLALTAVGQTSQLTVTAVSSDGTSKDVTTDAQWISSNRSIATVSADGVLTAVHLGATSVQARYFDKKTVVGFAAAGTVTVTPPGTFAAEGESRWPGNGPLPNVLVTETLSHQSTITNADGLFSFGGLTTTTAFYFHLHLSKEGFEPVERDVAPPSGGLISVYTGGVPMQRVVRVTAGQVISSDPLHNYDVAYPMPGGQSCQPCRLIHVDVLSNGTLHLQLTWSSVPPDFELWVNGQRFGKSSIKLEVDADVAVSAGELIVYVGSTSAGRGGTYTLATAFDRVNQ
jgi:hypothetical protein